MFAYTHGIAFVLLLAGILMLPGRIHAAEDPVEPLGIVINEDNSHFYTSHTKGDTTPEGLHAFVDQYGESTIRESAMQPSNNTDTVLMGMGIEDVVSEGGRFRIVTPGTAVVLGDDGVLHVHQRIGVERELLSLALDAHFAPWRIAQRTPFRCVLAGNGLTITVQGDSVLIFAPQQNMKLAFQGYFSPEYSEEVRGNRLLLDPKGGCGFFGIPPRPTQLEDGGAGVPWKLGCHLARWDELWVSVCPPRPEDAKRLHESISHDIMYYLYKDDELTGRYPSTESIKDMARYCRILAVHEEVWQDAPDWVEDPPGGAYEHPKPWETDRHVPVDATEFARMRDEAHRHGMKVVPYCSPYYSSAPDLYAEMERVLEEYQVDGLYFDGWAGSRDDFRPAYAMIRRAREILGDRIMYLHSSAEPFGSVGVYPPFVFAYADFCLRGESNRGGMELDPFLRYTVSGHQISNTVGMWCHYGSMGESGYHFVVPTTADIEAALRNHVRIWRQTRMWRRFPEELARFDREYYGRLAQLREQRGNGD